jgi:hypothetical protein
MSLEPGGVVEGGAAAAWVSTKAFVAGGRPLASAQRASAHARTTRSIGDAAASDRRAGAPGLSRTTARCGLRKSAVTRPFRSRRPGPAALGSEHPAPSPAARARSRQSAWGPAHRALQTSPPVGRIPSSTACSPLFAVGGPSRSWCVDGALSGLRHGKTVRRCTRSIRMELAGRCTRQDEWRACHDVQAQHAALPYRDEVQQRARQRQGRHRVREALTLVLMADV